jgi:hypothetical protein
MTKESVEKTAFLVLQNGRFVCRQAIQLVWVDITRNGLPCSGLPESLVKMSTVVVLIVS